MVYISKHRSPNHSTNVPAFACEACHIEIIVDRAIKLLVDVGMLEGRVWADDQAPRVMYQCALVRSSRVTKKTNTENDA